MLVRSTEWWTHWQRVAEYRPSVSLRTRSWLSWLRSNTFSRPRPLITLKRNSVGRKLDPPSASMLATVISSRTVLVR